MKRGPGVPRRPGPRNLNGPRGESLGVYLRYDWAQIVH